MEKEKKSGFPLGKLAKAKRAKKINKDGYWVHDFNQSFQYGRSYCYKFLTNIVKKKWEEYRFKLYVIIFVLTLVLVVEYMACGTIGEYCMSID